MPLLQESRKILHLNHETWLLAAGKQIVTELSAQKKPALDMFFIQDFQLSFLRQKNILIFLILSDA